jgi:hypothetical protein
MGPGDSGKCLPGWGCMCTCMHVFEEVFVYVNMCLWQYMRLL